MFLQFLSITTLCTSHPHNIIGYISTEIHANGMSGNQHSLLGVHVVWLRTFADEISADPKNNLGVVVIFLISTDLLKYLLTLYPKTTKKSPNLQKQTSNQELHKQAP